MRNKQTNAGSATSFTLNQKLTRVEIRKYNGKWLLSGTNGKVRRPRPTELQAWEALNQKEIQSFHQQKTRNADSVAPKAPDHGRSMIWSLSKKCVKGSLVENSDPSQLQRKLCSQKRAVQVQKLPRNSASEKDTLNCIRPDSFSPFLSHLNPMY